jgi:HlyD family secretion protein
MKRALPIIIGLLIVAAFAWTLLFLYRKSQSKPIVYETTTPTKSDLVKKTVATGAIVPREEVEIKPRVSGVIGKLAVEPGDYVKKNDLIAEIIIIPDSMSLNRAQASVKQARISFDNARSELALHQGLFEQKVISASEVSARRLDYNLRKQEYDAAVSNLQLVREGAASGSKQTNTDVRSTVEGMVLAVPVKLGESVIESNTFNAGTTVASIADMNQMIFQGKVDESEVGKIKAGMALDVRIGAIEKQTFAGELEYISPKGVMEEGAIQFEIKAKMKLEKGVFIRAGYSANADIVLDRRTQALVIDEGVLQFDDGKPYVEVETAPQTFERREIETGISDGIKIEVKGGLKETDRLKKPNRS